jgi:hypothetical protein
MPTPHTQHCGASGVGGGPQLHPPLGEDLERVAVHEAEGGRHEPLGHAQDAALVAACCGGWGWGVQGKVEAACGVGDACDARV